MSAEARRLDAGRLRREAAADRTEGYRLAEESLQRELQVCYEAEWLACHAEAAVLPLID